MNKFHQHNTTCAPNFIQAAAIAALNAAKGTAWSTDMMSLIQAGEIPGLTAIQNASMVRSLPGLLSHVFGRIAAVLFALIFNP